MNGPYIWERQGRRPAPLWVATLILIAALTLRVIFDAAWGVVLCITLLAVLPLWDWWRNRVARLKITPGRVEWSSALRDGASDDIAMLRLDRRFDGSMRITLLHSNGSHTRLPPDIAPPPLALEQALSVADIPCERHPFSVF